MESKPHQRVRTIDLARAAIEMERNPGKWMPIPTMGQDHNLVVYRQRSGQMAATMPNDRFESRTRNKIAYGRYVGKNSHP